MHAEKFFNPKLGLDEVDAVRNQSSDNTWEHREKAYPIIK